MKINFILFIRSERKKITYKIRKKKKNALNFSNKNRKPFEAKENKITIVTKNE